LNTFSLSRLSGDEQLWNGLILGDRDSLGAIYHKYVQDLFRFGCSLVHDEDLVRDAIQEVFVDLWKYHSTLQPTDKVKVYLFKCLSNRIQKESQSGQKRKAKLEKYMLDEEVIVESIETSLITAIQNRSLQTRLRKALEYLPLRQKEVINCLFFENFSYEETAKIMNINLRSVYTLAWKAISSLKESVGFRIFLLFALGLFS
jgi:RNA polymerase sigma factor (sigma-70 family)